MFRSIIVITAAVCWLLATRPVIGQTPAQERRDPTTPPTNGSVPGGRDIFVPLWTEPVGPDRAIPATVRRQRADFVWTDVSLQTRGVEAPFHPKGATALLVEMRSLAVQEPAGQRPSLAVTVRLSKPVERNAQPFLEVVDIATLLQSRGWGRLVRRTPDGAEWSFRVPDPVAPPPGQPNPISARVLRTPDPSRKLELRLVSEAPAPH